MALTDVQAVRLKTGDKSIITREVARGDNETLVYKLGHENVLSTPEPIIWLDGVLQVESSHYTIDLSNGVVTFLSAPTLDAEIVFQYYWAVFSDDEVNHFLTEANDSVTLAASNLLYAMAADAAKVAMRETLSGGGSFGSTTRDTSLTAQELRETAKALRNAYNEDEGAEFPVQEITEVAWTEHSYDQLTEQEVYRDLL